MFGKMPLRDGWMVKSPENQIQRASHWDRVRSYRRCRKRYGQWTLTLSTGCQRLDVTVTGPVADERIRVDAILGAASVGANVTYADYVRVLFHTYYHPSDYRLLIDDCSSVDEEVDVAS